LHFPGWTPGWNPWNPHSRLKRHESLDHAMFGAPLLDPESHEVETEQGQRGHARWVEVAGATCMLMGVAQLVALAHTSAGGDPDALVLAAESKKGLLDSHAFCSYYDLLLPAAPWIRDIGILLFVLIFILSTINKIKDFKGTVKIVEGFGLPCPTFMTIGAILDLIAGCVCYLTGIPVLMEWGAEFILIFMILASYVGHFKPWRETKEEFHMEMLLKNAAIIGQCLLTIGFEVPEIGKDGTPLGLNGALGSFGEFIGKIYRALKPYSYIFKYSGIILFVLVFLFGGLKHLLNFKETVEINKTFGIPLPTLSALVGPLLLLAGSGMYLTGIPVFMEIGAECLLLFLLMSTCFVHFKPLQQSGGKDFKQMLHTLKNISMAGGCLMTIGAVLPQICQ